MEGDTTSSHEPEDDQEPDLPRRISRRVLLRTGTIGAGAAAAFSAIPGLSGLLGGASSAAPEITGAGAETSAVVGDAAPALEGPIVAHITNAATGDISLYVGEREIAYRDSTLVAHLLHAAR